MAGRLPKAERLYRRVLRADPDQPVALHLLGVVVHQRGESALSVELISKALAIKPDYADAHGNLAIVFKDRGELAAAVACHRKALAITPDAADIHNNLGAVLHDMGQLDEAVESYRAALAILPGYAAAHNNLGKAFRDMGRLDAAAESYRAALAITPQSADVLNNLGLVFHGQGQLDRAAESYRAALAITPDHAEAHSNLGAAFQDLGNLDNALASYRKALALRPGYTKAHSNLIFCMNYDEHSSQHDIYTESRHWEAAHGASGAARIAPHHHDRDPERRLRIGYVSPDFRSHSVSHFLDPLIASHDRRQFEIFCYAQVANPDIETRRLRGLADGWCSSVGMTTQALAARIRADKIDILVDLAGHTANSRLLVFAECPAPVQAA
jgi:predicted O-linked N-acetylglucosamine transferase (SPINDLY family)